MKRICLLLILVTVFFISCDLFKSDDSGSEVVHGKSVANVKLSVVKSSEKNLETFYPSGVTESFQYKATLQSGDTSAQGTKTQWTDFSNNTSVGYFALGTWKFEVRMICGNSTEYGVVCQGSTTVNLSETSKTVAITLSNVYNTLEDGTMEFDISVPAISSSNGSLKIYVDDVLASPDTCDVSKTGSDIHFKGDLDAAAGFRTIRFEFWDTSVDSSKCISSQTVVVRIVENTKVGLSGTLTGSVYSEVEFEVTYNNLSVSVSGPSSAALNTNTRYTCTANGGSSYNYQWYVNGVASSGATSSTYNFNAQHAGVYSVSCIVWCMDGTTKIYASSGVEVTVR